MNNPKFKPGDKVIIYGKVKAIIVKVGIVGYEVAYRTKIGSGSNTGYYKEHSLELIEVWESPLYQAMREEHDEQG